VASSDHRDHNLWSRAHSVMHEACSAWVENNALSTGAALAFYTIFSFAPVLIVATSVAGLAFGRSAAEREVLLHLQSLIGGAGVRAVQPLVQGVAGDTFGVFASTIGILTLFFGASGAFVELQDALNRIWKVKRPSENVLPAFLFLGPGRGRGPAIDGFAGRNYERGQHGEVDRPLDARSADCGAFDQ